MGCGSISIVDITKGVTPIVKYINKYTNLGRIMKCTITCRWMNDTGCIAGCSPVWSFQNKRRYKGCRLGHGPIPLSLYL